MHEQPCRAWRVWGPVLLLTTACFSKPGRPAEVSTDAPPTSPPTGDAEQQTLAAAGQHACAITSAGALWCWGDNTSSELGGAGPGPVEVTRPEGHAWEAVAAGTAHTCGIAGEAVYCWGYNAEQQISPVAGNKESPTRLALTKLVPASLSLGASFSCVHGTENGLAQTYCAGQMDYAEPVLATLAAPYAPPANETWRRIVSSDMEKPSLRHHCGLTTAGSLWCWGRGNEGQLGVGTPPAALVVRAQARKVEGAFREVAAGGAGTCAISTEGKLLCWGTWLGQQSNVPTTISSTVGWHHLVMDKTHACALDSQQQLACWGMRGSGAMKEPLDRPGTQPTPMLLGETAMRVAVAVDLTCFSSGQDVKCLGQNARGQLGLGRRGLRGLPAPVADLTGKAITALIAGEHFTCAGDSDTVWRCWGENFSNQFATGRAIAAVPIEVAGDSLVAGGASLCNHKADGSFTCQGKRNVVSAPGVSVKELALSDDRLCTQTDNTVTCDGRTFNLQFSRLAVAANYVAGLPPLLSGVRVEGTAVPTEANGAGTTTGVEMRIGTVTNLEGVAASPQTLCAWGNDGHRCFGSGQYRGTGNNKVKQLAVTDARACWLSGNTLTCGGDMVIQGESLNVSGAWERFAMGARHICMVSKAEPAKVYCLGNGEHGELGDSSANSSVPVVVRLSPG